MRLPNSQNRIAIMGKTGSGKSVAGLWHLSKQPFDAMPWVIVDYKGDDNIASIEGATHGYSLENGAPRKPGIYVVNPMQGDDDKNIDLFLRDIHSRGNIGVFIDEGYMIPKRSGGMLALLTQGRSKNIPMIVLSQRPVEISRFVFSEAEFYQLYHLNDRRDRKIVEEFLPRQDLPRLPEYHSYYYDVVSDQLVRMKPVPHPDLILDDIEDKLNKI